MKEMNHWVKLLTAVLVGMFPPKQTRRCTGLGKTDLFHPVKGKMGVCAIPGKRQMLTEHDWLLERLYLKIVFLD